ncbi:MAG: hypothetical protein Q9214_003060, partial [Letrouitia sp. 1 TL-2023]
MKTMRSFSNDDVEPWNDDLIRPIPHHYFRQVLSTSIMSASEHPDKPMASSVKPTLQYTENFRSPNMATQLFERFDGREITHSMLQDAAKLFNDNYGIWGKDPTSSRSIPKPGSRVRLSKDRLRAQCLPDNVICSYVKVTIEDNLAGNAFACRWRYKEDQIVCWVTQLVVHRNYREHGLATSLLNQIRQNDDAIYGIMSSHPAACLAAAKAFGSGINNVASGFIRDNAEAIMKGSPISYVKDAELRGSLFDSTDTSGAVSSVDTSFFVDHTEPLKALDWASRSLDTFIAFTPLGRRALPPTLPKNRGGEMSSQYDAIQAPYDLLREKSIACIERENVQTTIAPFITGARVLELACGSGFYTREFLPWGARAVVGVDISKRMLAEARRQVAATAAAAAAVRHDVLSSSLTSFPSSNGNDNGDRQQVDFIRADCGEPTLYSSVGPQGNKELFDVVFGAWLLNYAPDRQGLVRMFRNVCLNLREGGRFVGVTVPPAEDPRAS